MICPSQVTKILLEILRDGLLRIRALGWNDNAPQCAVEADHLHNLPDLLHDFSIDLLKYYWQVTRPNYAAQSAQNGIGISVMDPLWSRLRPFVEGGDSRTHMSG